ncbi:MULTISPECIES: galactan 5-O-arabinofuranosyltransferase [unclassified Rhodococcus (in: high G+C Gram-positive bacteria)]|uniref:galactan 5-O-arabinofuranosyltransferase n=1 Tax=unclassified Rhodococcus (in: high G+C Gram-positive bacteria) TaxID=192944 RepID=UPI00163A05C1|nr:MULTISPECIES: galactan 5-O-arabinofuranosyltransferase [unclassified Rhodococcus (in: high G+C Gram-positive bacteria)]MBC2641426.1 galactan 5-O-arabinofuranosyltransferase [Rhodococcus sp. 3A]MBC2893829.1 galactan 5-O-arabinofuranosyltransferase [Rhodococcus sp. 4CII]
MTEADVAPARRSLSTAVEMLLGAVVAAVVAAVGLFAFARVQWPAFNSSNVTQAVTTVGQVAAIAGIAVSVLLVRLHRAPRFARLLSWVSLSGFVTVTLGLPLAATKLYLHGVSVDQEFRTEYLTRLTDSAALHDMTYADLPPYYPAGWFWVGGRVANLLGMDGWEAFKPYAIGSLAVAAVVALVLWSNLIRHDLAIVVSVATSALVLAYGSPEPYGAVITLLIGPALVLAWGGLNRVDGRGGWGAVIGTGLFLGLAATFYTLYLGLAAFAITLLALLAAALRIREQKSWRAALDPLVRLIVIAAVSGLLALTVWLPYLLTVVGGSPAASGTALHYLPEAGAHLPLPMIHFSLTGALCLLGTVWLVARASSSRRAQALGVGVVAIYLWSLLSMAVTVLGSTLLSFRLEPVLIVLLGAAGVFGFVEFAGWLVLATSDNPRVKWSVLVIGVLGALSFVQNIPKFLDSDIAVAYTDTDGNGERADQRPPGAAAHYAAVDELIQAQVPRDRDDTVVLTADTSFLSFYPYLGFQALTSHYSNPLADFAGRAQTIADWSELETPDQLVAALDSAAWRAPDAFVFRQGPDGYTLRLAEDVYPNDPNVRRYTVTFPKELFDDPRFTVSETGPFVVVTRN